MTITATPVEDRYDQVHRLLTLWLSRLAAIVMFAIGVEYWVRLVGFYDGALWRFDLMPVPWKMAASALAVLYPVAGVGLWMTVSWGTVIWIIVAGVELVMHLVFPALFGAPTLTVLFHLLGLSSLSALRLVGWWEYHARLRRAGDRRFATKR